MTLLLVHQIKEINLGTLLTIEAFTSDWGLEKACHYRYGTQSDVLLRSTAVLNGRALSFAGNEGSGGGCWLWPILSPPHIPQDRVAHSQGGSRSDGCAVHISNHCQTLGVHRPCRKIMQLETFVISDGNVNEFWLKWMSRDHTSHVRWKFSISFWHNIQITCSKSWQNSLH